MKKFVVLLATLSMVASLTACKGSFENEGEKDKKESTATEITVEEKITVGEKEKSEQKAEDENLVKGEFYLSGSTSAVNGTVYFGFIPEGEDEYITEETEDGVNMTLNGYAVMVEDKDFAEKLKNTSKDVVFYAELAEAKEPAGQFEEIACMFAAFVIPEDEIASIAQEIGIDPTNEDAELGKDDFINLWNAIKNKGVLDEETLAQIDEAYNEYVESIGTVYTVSSINLEETEKKAEVAESTKQTAPSATADLKRENVNISELTSGVTYNPVVDVVLYNDTDDTYVINFDNFGSPSSLNSKGVIFISGASFWIEKE